jgi:hypothetical protein
MQNIHYLLSSHDRLEFQKDSSIHDASRKKRNKLTEERVDHFKTLRYIKTVFLSLIFKDDYILDTFHRNICVNY